MPSLFLLFMAAMFVLTSLTVAGSFFANRRVTIRADDDELLVMLEGTLGKRRLRIRRDAIAAIYADRYWVWIYGPRRPKHLLWQRLPDERFWVAGTLARLLDVWNAAPLAAGEVQVRAVVLDDDTIRRPPCPVDAWTIDMNEWEAYLRIEHDGAILRLFSDYPSRIRFHRFLGLAPREWLAWLPLVFKQSSEVMPQCVQWVQRHGVRCLHLSFVTYVGEKRERMTLILWHPNPGVLEPLHQLLAQREPIEA